MVVPALLAVYFASWEAPDRTPKVTEVLDAISQGDNATRARVQSDSPVASATEGGGDISIDFKRGSRVPLGTMEIPAIGLRTKFFDGVVDEAVELGPGHWPGTPWPGQAGNSVFAGHRTTYTRPFADLDLLQKGARVRIGMRNDKPITYRVFKTSIATEAEYANVVLEQPRSKKARIITLFACTPKGSRSHRIIVQARAMPVGAKPEKQGGAR
ncbi:MAG TPA: class E sortase [Actinomycetota bacterium]|nr:class E sortase [Actinomycetota bacterium]